MEKFLAALAAADLDKAASYTDQKDATEQAWNDSWKGLQAEGLTTTLKEVNTAPGDGVSATAQYTVSWRLPQDREFSYDASATLTRNNGAWTIRYQPTMIFPRLGAQQHLELRPVQSQKANVVSADGAELMRPGLAYRILVDTAEMTTAAQTASAIAAALDQLHDQDESVPTMAAGDLAHTLAEQSGTYSVAALRSPIAAGIEEKLADVPGVRINQEPAMVRSDPGFAPELMARVENVIADGQEGTPGWTIAAVNPNGAVIDTFEKHQPEAAPAIRVSIDHSMQVAAQEAVDLRPEMKAMIVAIRPSSGDILAVAQTKKADEDGDVALSGQFPPGSTFKMITAAAGMQRLGLNPESIVPCPGTMEIGNRIVHNYNDFSKGNVPLQAAFAASCNTSFADISAQLEPGQLQQDAKSFGLGRDFDIPGFTTLTGSVPPGQELVDRTEAGFGQGKDLASPFGLALVAATAAHGQTPIPQLISGHPTTVKDPDVPAPAPEVIENLQHMMRAVVTEGTARGMRSAGEIHGKTGEAEIAGGSHAWFAGYRDDVAFATLIVLGGGSESSVAITDHFLSRMDELKAAGLSSAQ